MWLLSWRRESKKSSPRPASPPRAFATIEPMEPRQLLAAAPALVLQNLDVVPGNERMVFNRIGHLDAKVPNVVHDRAVLRLRNTGGQTLRINRWQIKGPWIATNNVPASIAPGRFVDVKLKFIANAPPAYTYNQTNGTFNPRKAGAYAGTLTFNTNDPAHPTQVEQLAGWYQDRSESAEEPNLQTMLNLIFNYKTRFATGRVIALPEPSGKKLYGEEVNSAYWSAADPSKSVSVRQLASWHTQGNPVTLSWFAKGTTTNRKLFTTAGAEGQSFLPHVQGSSSTPAAGSFKPGSTKFGFKIDYESSVDSRNHASGGGHHVRFYPVRDHNGRVLANTYFMIMDYSVAGSGAGAQNFDFQDNVYVVSNVKPGGN
jgi:hypothetical protein